MFETFVKHQHCYNVGDNACLCMGKYRTNTGWLVGRELYLNSIETVLTQSVYRSEFPRISMEELDAQLDLSSLTAEF